MHRNMVEAQLYMMLETVRQSRTSRQVVAGDETKEESGTAALKIFRTTMVVYWYERWNEPFWKYADRAILVK